MDRRSVPLFCAGTLLYWASIYVYAPILPVYARELGASLSVVGLVVAAYGLPQLFLRIPIGVWSDHLARRKPFVLAGVLSASAGAIGFILFANPWALIGFRAAHGVAAAMWVVFAVLFASYFPPQRSVRAMGQILFFTGLAQVLATWSGGFLAQEWGWLAPFYASLGLGILGILFLLPVRDEPGTKRVQLSLPRLWQVGTSPLLLWVSIIAAITLFTSYGVSYGFLPVYAAQLGATRVDQGNLMSTMLVMNTLAMSAGGFLADRWGERTAVARALLLMTAAVAAMPFVHNLWLLGGLHVVLGLGRGITYPVLMGLSVKKVPQGERATAMGVFQAVYSLGMILGPMVGGVLGDLGGLEAVFFLLAGLTAVGSLVAWLKIR